MAKITFTEYLHNYKEWRAKAMGDKSQLSEKEINAVRADFKKKIQESKKVPARRPVNEPATKVDGFAEALAGYREWKKTNVGTSIVTLKEKEGIKAELLADKKLKESTSKKPVSKFVEACREYKKFKVTEMKDNSPLTEAEKSSIRAELKIEALQEKLSEAARFVRKASRKLSEADMLGAADATQQAGAAVNDATGMAGDIQAGDANTPATPLPQNIIDEISTIKTSVDALATEAGIESPVDLGSDPNAGVPGTTGVGDPNAAAAPADPNAGMMESMTSAQKRIAERNARLAENGDIVNATKNIDKSGYSTTKATGSGNLETNAEEVKVPGTSALLSGTATGPAAKEMAPANRWPTKPIKEPAMTKKLGNIEEADEETPAEDKLEESWAEKRVQAELNKPKFDWNAFLASDANLGRR